MKIILDTNFLVYCAKQNIDYIEKIFNLTKGAPNLVVPSQVIDELKKLGETAKKYSDKQAAELAIKLLKANKVKTIIITARNADSAIIKASKGNIVATHDLELLKQVEKAIIIQGKQKLAFS
jgi:rRNA-processing protein FCF1